MHLSATWRILLANGPAEPFSAKAGMLKSAVFFMRYTKPALTLEQQVDDKFLTRGPIVPDRERALRWLRVVGYYRLSAYFLPFRIVVNSEAIPQGRASRVS